MKKIEWKIDGDDLIYETGINRNSNAYEFQKFKAIRYFGRKVYSGVITPNDAFKND